MNKEVIRSKMLSNNLTGDELDFVARFACLMYGVNIAAEAAEKMGMNTEKDSDWIKPIVFQKYVQERFEDMKFNIQRSQEGKGSETYSW